MKKQITQWALWMVCSTFFMAQTNAQITLVSPTSDGGFETGATFAANGWTVVTNTVAGVPQTNQWYVGGVAKNGGMNGAYISNDAGVTNAYTVTSSSVAHFYRDVTIPAGQTLLTASFDFKGVGEVISTSFFDYIRVYIAPTSVVPVGGTEVAAVYNVGGSFNNATTFSARAVSASVTPGSTVRLIFSWRNDGSSGMQPAGALDNISVIARNPLTFTSATTGNWTTPATWTQGYLPTSGDNVVVANGHTVTVDAIGLVCTNLTVGQGTSGVLDFSAAATQIGVRENLMVAAGALMNCFNGTAGKSIVINGNVTNNGTIDLTYAPSTLTLTGATPQTISGTGDFSTCNGIRQLTLQNPTGATLAMPLTITSALQLISGILTNGNKLKFNNLACATGTASTSVTVTRSQISALTQTPTIEAGTTYNVSYLSSSLGTIASITEGYEIPTTRIINSLTINNAKGVNLTGDLTLTAATAALTLTSGVLQLPNSNTLLCSSPNYTGISGSTSSFVSGGGVALTSSTTTSSRSFPVGSDGVNRAVTLANVASVGVTTLKVLIVPAEGNGTQGTGLMGLSGTRRWVLTKTGADLTTTTATIALTYGVDDGYGSIVTANRKLAQSATLAGTYDNILATANTNAAVLTSSNVATIPGLNLATINAGTSYFALASTVFLPPYWDGGALTSNWGDANNWSGNTVPNCLDEVFIMQNATVNLAGGSNNYEARNLYVGVMSTLTMSNAAKTLTIGSCGKTAGDNQTMNIDGTFNLSNGTVKVNGKVTIATTATTPTQFNMSGGLLSIDGNDGTAGGSIAGDLISFGSSSNTLMSINATGGTILFVDPPFTASSSNRALAISINSANTNMMTFAGNTIQFGDGLSTQVGTGISGFVFDTYTSTRNVRLGHVIVNGGDNPLRFVSSTMGSGDASDIGGNLIVNVGSELRSAGSKGIGVVGNIINNGTISLTVATSGGLLIGGFNSAASGNATPTTAPVISGSGVWRNNLMTASATASMHTLTVDINGTLTLNIPLSISGTLTMTNGNINTTAGILSVGAGILPAASTLATATITRTAGMIVGQVARVMPAATIAAGNAAALFPVGDGTNYAPIAINYTVAPTSLGVVKAEFIATNPSLIGLPLTAYGGVTIATASPSGFWSVTSTTTDGQYTATGDASAFKKTVGNTLITDFTTIRLIKRPKNGAWTAEGMPAVPTTLSAVALNGLTTYGEFGIGSSESVIPVELVYFRGKILTNRASTEGSTHVLQWATATERNTASFIVERSNNGVSHWSTIAEQKAAGASNALLMYTATDENPLAVNYYRLKMIDFDGKTQYSNTVTLVRENGKFGILALYPTPMRETGTLDFEAIHNQDVIVTIVDVTGRILSQQTVAAQKGVNTLNIHAANLSKGVYFLSLNDGYTQETTRFIKQ